MNHQTARTGAARPEMIPARGRGPNTSRALAVAVGALAAGIATASLVGPLGLGLLRYRTSQTTLNQLLGSDAAALFVVAPVAVVTAVLAGRRHRAAPALAAGVGGYGLYTYAQVIIGQEYLRLPGNVEYFFPLLLAVFVLAEATLVLAVRSTAADPPDLTPRLRRTAGVALLTVAAFLVVGLHLPTMVTAWHDPTALTEYASSPTPFWMVKLMDLGIIVPGAVATGIGLLRGSTWAARVGYPLLTGYTCLAVSVAAMALVMLAGGDPDASPPLAVGFTVFAGLFLAITAALYRPLFTPMSVVR